jgi:hypothetical protein
MHGVIRRTVLLLALALLPLSPAVAQETYRGWSIDISSAKTDRDALMASLSKQIDLVESLPVKPEIKAWFRAIPLIIDPNLLGGGFVKRGVLSLRDEAIPEERPVLLHELLHIYHAQKMPQGHRNPMILAFYNQAKTAGYAPNSYMLSNPVECFATVVSTVLAGKAERPPFTRERVKQLQPDFHDWIVFEFGLKIAN